MTLEPGTGFYYGSRLLEPVGQTLGLSIDQVNYVVSQLVGVLLAVPFRRVLHPSKVSPEVRHGVQILLGAVLVYFCFGSQLIHLIMESVMCYLIMWLFPQQMHSLCFVSSLGYLAMMHIHRQVYDYGGYTLDITGPLMISTQKLSDLAFCVHDGMVKNEDSLNTSQKKYMLKSQPSLLEILSYTLSFHNVMLGPTVFYKDYKEFIEGHNIGVHTPDYKSVIRKKIFTITVCIVITMFIQPSLPAQTILREQWYLNSGFFSQITYMLASISLIRAKYYFAWSLSELTNVVAGLGFTGLKEDGTEDWSMITNANIWDVEMCLSMKVNMDSWNIRTLLWLRRVVYDRAPFANTLAVFAVSAFWHGFYPGYYIAFGTAALFIFSGRSIRRFIRPFFQKSGPMSVLYDIITFIFTRFCNVYMASPFLIYEFQPIYYFYKAQYFWLHILSILAIVLIPKRPSSRAKRD